MEKYTQFVLKRPKITLLAIVIITIIFSFGLPNLEFDYSIESMMPKRDAEYRFYKKTQETFGNVSKFIIMDIFGPNLWSDKGFKDIDNLITDIEEFRDFNKEIEDTRLEKFDLISSKGRVEYDELLDEFNDDATFQRLLKRKKSKLLGEVEALDDTALIKLRAGLLRTYNIKKNERIERISSIFTSGDVNATEDTLEYFDIIKKDEYGNRILPKTEEEYDRIKKILLKTPAYEQAFYAKDAKTGEITDLSILLILDTSDNHHPIAEEMWDIENSYKNVEILSQGVPTVNMLINGYMESDLKIYIPSMLIIMLMVFFFNFRSARGIALPLFTLILSDVWLLGFMGLFNFKITVLGVGLPGLMMAIGSSYSIHIMNQYYIDFDLISEKGRYEGLRLAMSHISITVLLAGITTAIGFLTITANQITAIREWAFLAGLGAVFCVIVPASIIPAFSVMLPHKMPRIMLTKDRVVKTTLVDRIIALMTAISLRHHKSTLVIVIVIIAVSVVGVFKMDVEMTPFGFFKEDNYIRVTDKIFGKKFGGSFSVNILIDSGEMDGIKRPEFLKRVDELSKWLLSDENIDLNLGRATSFHEIVKKLHMAMNNDDISYYKIPNSYTDILDYFELLTGEDSDSDGRIDDMELFIDPEFRRIHMLAMMYSKEKDLITSTEIEQILNKINRQLDKMFPNYSTRITGDCPIFIRLSKYVVQGQVLSLLLCLFIVGIIIIMLFKNLLIGLIALIPMSCAVILNFGIMGLLGINLDMATAIIASITIGIGVDDTIHFFNTFRHYKAQGCDTDQAITKTLAIAGKAIIFTSLALIFGFSVFVLSEFKPNMYFGILVAITMTATTIGALVVLPSTIKATGIDVEESDSKSIIWKYLYIGKLFRVES
ncbi:MAG: efflux RND transporter permease subunit [Spirochaetota bacterium]|nr:efflux RND transporter permease subunit [Spirochaetota bacterium]